MTRLRAIAGRFFRAAAVGFALPLAIAFVLLAIWPPVSRVETGGTPEYPDLQPAAYGLGRERVHAALVQVVEAWPEAELGRVDPASATVEWTAPAALARLRTRMRAEVQPNGEGGSIVFVTSESDGRGDFGQNARNIERTLRVLDEQLGVRRPESE